MEQDDTRPISAVNGPGAGCPEGIPIDQEESRPMARWKWKWALAGALGVSGLTAGIGSWAQTPPAVPDGVPAERTFPLVVDGSMVHCRLLHTWRDAAGARCHL